MQEDQHLEWMKSRHGFFTSSETVRLMAGVDDPELLGSTKLRLAIEGIKKLKPKDFSASDGKPYVKPLRAVLEWHDEITAAETAYAMKMMDPYPDGLKTYAEEKAVELMTEFRIENELKVPHILWGKEQETIGISTFAMQMNLKPENIGEDQEFIVKDEVSGSTPDAVIRDDKGVIYTGIEAKCPNSRTHANYRINIKDAKTLKEEEPKYYWQIMDQMRCTDAGEWYFISFDPRYSDPALHLHTIVIKRNDEDIAKIEKRLAMATEWRNAYMDKLIKGGES